MKGLNYINVSDYSENVKKTAWKTFRYLKSDYQFFDALKTKNCKISGNCNLLI